MKNVNFILGCGVSLTVQYSRIVTIILNKFSIIFVRLELRNLLSKPFLVVLLQILTKQGLHYEYLSHKIFSSFFEQVVPGQ